MDLSYGLTHDASALAGGAESENDRVACNRVLHLGTAPLANRVDQVRAHQMWPDDHLSIVPGSVAAPATVVRRGFHPPGVDAA